MFEQSEDETFRNVNKFVEIDLIFGVLAPLSAISLRPVLVVEEANISAISLRPVLMVEEARVPGENHRPWASNW